MPSRIRRSGYLSRRYLSTEHVTRGLVATAHRPFHDGVTIFNIRFNALINKALRHTMDCKRRNGRRHGATIALPGIEKPLPTAGRPTVCAENLYRGANFLGRVRKLGRSRKTFRQERRSPNSHIRKRRMLVAPNSPVRRESPAQPKRSTEGLTPGLWETCGH